jgi:YegS/Rv2252/BmrU family lipid kinase
MGGSRKKAIMVVNPASGRGGALSLARKAQRMLEGEGLECPLFQTLGPGHGREVARNQGNKIDVLVSVGGDGTLNEVVNGLADIGSDTPIAIIPAGTINVVFKELGLPRDFQSQVRLALESDLRRLDLGLVDQRYFVLCAGAGFGSSVIHAMTRKRSSRRMTPLRFVPLIINEAFRYRFPSMEVRVDGVLAERRSNYTVVGNMSLYGGIFRLFSRADPEDGLLDVCCLQAGKMWDLGRFAWAAYQQRLHRMKGVSYYQGKSIILESNDPVLFQIDGDPCGSLPVSIQVVPRAVTFCLPA